MVFINIKTSTSWIIGFWLKQACPKFPKKGSLLRFCNILRRRSIVTVFAFCCDAKHSDTLQGPSHVCYYLTCFWKHSNCLDFARSVSPSLWYAVPVFWIKSICTGFHVSHQKNFHIYIIFHQQCNSYLECYKKHNSF